jgi:hypothetical protein
MSDEPITQQSTSEPQWTVAELQDRLQHILTALTAEVTHLDQWAASQPLQHRPPEPVRVAQLALRDHPDPTALTRHVQEVGTLVAKATAVTELARTVASTEMEQGFGMEAIAQPSTAHRLPQEESVIVTARLGSAFGDDETFESQRHAARRALVFDGHGSWHGMLPRIINDDPSRWQAVLEAAEAGAEVRLDPVPAAHQAPAR